MNQENGESKFVKRAQVTAWGVLLGSFLLFVLACIGGTAGVYWFFFKSPTDMTVRVRVSQGSLTVLQADGTNLLVNNNDRDIFVPQNAIIQSNSTSQGYLTFEDTYSEQVIATVFLLPNSSLSLRSATRPRFEWSGEAYTFDLNGISGHFAIDIPVRIRRVIVLSMESSLVTARFGQYGSYFLDVGDKREQLYAQAGTALMYTADRAVQIEGGMQGVLQQDQNSLTVQPYPYEIVNWQSSNGYTFGLDDFPDDMASLSTDDKEKLSTELPLLWGCTNYENNPSEISGTWIRTKIDQHVVIQMQRTGKGLDHAETSCQYTFAAPPATGLPVSPENTLSIRAKFKIDFQDVTTCGILGTECPVMLELTYRALGQKQDESTTWHHGFYAIRPPDDNSPKICDSCPNVHEQVNPKTWFIYDSGDLFKLLPNQPVEIIAMRVYASGHQYNIALADLVVLVGTPQ